MEKEKEMVLSQLAAIGVPLPKYDSDLSTPTPEPHPSYNTEEPSTSTAHYFTPIDDYVKDELKPDYEESQFLCPNVDFLAEPIPKHPEMHCFTHPEYFQGFEPNYGHFAEDEAKVPGEGEAEDTISGAVSPSLYQPIFYEW